MDMGASFPARNDRNSPQFGTSDRPIVHHRPLRAAFVDFDAHRWLLLLKVVLRSLSSLALVLFLVVFSTKYGLWQDMPTSVVARKLSMNNGFSSAIAKGKRVEEGQQFQSLPILITENRKESATANEAMFRHRAIGVATADSVNGARARQNSGAGGKSIANFYSKIFQDLLDEGLLTTNNTVLCLGRYANKEVIALKEKGVPNTIAVTRPHGIRLKQLFGDEIFDFEFSAEFDNALQPALLVSEIERTLKVGGSAAMHVSLATWREKFIYSELGHRTKPVTLLFHHSKIVYVSTAHALGLDTIIVFQKISKLKTKSTSATIRHENDDRASILAASATANELASVSAFEGIQSPTLLDVPQPLKQKLYIYMSVGLHSLDQCITDWLKMLHPKNTDNALSEWLEMGGPFQAKHALNSQEVSFHAAWKAGCNLGFCDVFCFQHHDNGNEAMNPVMIEGEDCIDWFNKRVEDDELEVIKMVAKGTNLQVVYPAIKTETISLIHEMFLTCQHPTSWKDIILIANYQRSDTQCTRCFTTVEILCMMMAKRSQLPPPS